MVLLGSLAPGSRVSFKVRTEYARRGATLSARTRTVAVVREGDLLPCDPVRASYALAEPGADIVGDDVAVGVVAYGAATAKERRLGGLLMGSVSQPSLPGPRPRSLWSAQSESPINVIKNMIGESIHVLHLH